MRHLNSGRKLNRNHSHRVLMLCNMANSLIFYEIIKTTLPKARELKKMIEPIICISKKDSLSNRRLVFSKLRNKKNTLKIFKEIGPRFSKTSGGYTSVIKCSFRHGDNALMAYIKFSDV